MRKLTLLIALTAASIVAAPATASAATDIGNPCVATSAPMGVTLVMTAKSGLNPLPIAAPSDGVITKATVAVPATPTVIPTQLKTFRATSVMNQYQTVASTGNIPVTGGTNTFEVRVPIKAGDLIGLTSSAATLACGTGNAADVVGQFAGTATVGSTQTYTPVTSQALPVVASIEADADNDGFGDETQDRCPQSALYQDECPVIILDSFAFTGRSSLTVLVATDNLADVTVSGTVKVRKAGKGKRASTTVKLNGGTQTIKAGALARFTVKFPKALKRALKELPANKSVKATLTASSTDVTGRVSTDTSKAKLQGTG